MSQSIDSSGGGVVAALYARVSSDKRAQAGTIQSQIDAILRRVGEDGE